MGIWSSQFVPAYFAELLPPVADSSRFASDLAPQRLSVAGVLSRLSFVVAAVGLVFLAAALHSRPDAGTAGLMLSGCALVAAAMFGAGFAAASLGIYDGQRAIWRAHHETARSRGDFDHVDLARVAGRVRLEPGRSLSIDVVMTVSRAGGTKRLVFSLNPGLRVAALSVDGRTVPYSHDQGLLTLELGAADSSGEVLVSVQASGLPDPGFAYLDEALDGWGLFAGSQMHLLGRRSAIFEESFVALTPAIHWLPTLEANLDRDAALDFFNVDLTVEVPEGWTVAGPGVRTPDGQGGFRFRPRTVVPDVALFASRFRKRDTVAAGVLVELLLHEDHSDNVGLFQDAADAISEQLAELFANLRELGVGYPFADLSIVEVPPQLRTYGGGCYMQARMSFPGIVLVRETGFPTASLRQRLEPLLPYADQPGVVAYSKAYMLARYTRSDSKGADSLRGLAENLLVMTASSGEGAVIMDFLLVELASRLLPLHTTGNAMSALTEPTHGRAMGVIGSVAASLALNDPRYMDDTGRYDGPGAWEAAMESPLMAVDDNGDCRSSWPVVALRVQLLAESLFDALGATRVGRLLDGIRTRFAGRTFSRSDLADVWRDLDLPHHEILNNGLDQAALPGFIGQVSEIVPLTDALGGSRGYEVRARVANGGSVPGLAYLSSDRFGWGERSATFKVGAQRGVVAGLVADHAPEQVWLHSYMSLNRTAVQLQIHGGIDDSVSAREPLGVAQLRPDEAARMLADAIASALVVDDLDRGFSSQPDPAALVWPPLGHPNQTLDRGLPRVELRSARIPRGRWYRREEPEAWGRFRRTVAIAAAGSGLSYVVLTTRLPSAGAWYLDFHLPASPLADLPGDAPRGTLTDGLGVYEIVLQTASGETTVAFDGGAALPGWNRLGSFEMDAGNAAVLVTDRTSGEWVVVDAIRWREAS